jgi:uncharacterized protein YegL
MTENLNITTRPGGVVASRPLHFIWILDVSGSMSNDGKIQALNHAICEAIPHMKEEAAKHCEAQLFVRAITFSSGAQWHISQPTRIEDFKWEDTSANGVTDMGKALSMVAEQLKMPPMPERGFRPVLVLISDGQPTDDYKTGLNALFSERWGRKASRVAIAIGKDANYDVLQQFINHPEIKPLKANNADSLAKCITFASTVPTSLVVNPPSQTDQDKAIDPIMPPPPDWSSSADDVW